MEPAERLQRLWEEGRQPDLDLFLAETGSLTPEQLIVVLRVDQRRRWQQGAPVRAEAYLKKYAFLRNNSENVVDLIYSEYLLHEEAGEKPVIEEYVLRFPEYANELRTQIGLHGAMASWSMPDHATSSSEVPSSHAAAAPDREASLRGQGPSIPGFDILDVIGRGGMGVVYKARQVRLKRIVALKMLLAGGHAGREQLARFRTEAEAAARLHHPNIVEIYEVGDVDGRPFLVLEYVADGNLKQNLGTKPPLASSAAQLVETLARAMHYAHQQGVVHRDLKPANILLSLNSGQHTVDSTEDQQSGRLSTDYHLLSTTPKITDFGLAKQLTASMAAEQTQSGAILGTPSYMAPEQAAGNARQVGPAADIYALGAILYELLTGRPPFLGDTPLQTLQRVARDEPVLPSRLLAGLPYDLETICLKCLEKDPQKRYTTALALAEDLGRFSANEPIRARPVGSTERLWRWCKRNPGWAAALGLLIVIAVGASVLSLQLLAALGRTQEAEAEVESKLYQSRIAEARAKSLSRRSGQRFESLSLLDLARSQLGGRDLPPEKLMELRNATLGALGMPDIYRAQVWAGFPPGSVQVDFNDGLEIYARTDEAGNCSIRRVADDREMYSFACGPGSGAVLSRDGRFMATWTPDLRVRIWRLHETEAQLLLTETKLVWIDFHPNRSLVAFSHTDGALSLYDLAPVRKISQLSPNALTREVVFALHPSQPWVAVGSYFSKVIQVRDWLTGAIVKTIEMPEGCSHVAWHTSGLLAASEGDGPNIHVFDRATFERQRKVGPIWGGSHVYFNHTGDRLATVGWDASLRLFDFGTGQLLVQLPYTRTVRLRFSADDHRLAGFLGDGELGIWNIADGREYRTLTHRAGYQSADSAAVSPDGRLLAVTLTDGISLWDLAAGAKLAFVPLEQPAFVQFDQQGALVTRERSGVYRWPVHADSKGQGHLRFGPPSPLSFPPSGQLSQSRDSRVLAVGARAAGSEDPFAGVWVLDRDNHENLIHLAAGIDIWAVAVSPDGNWVTSVNFTSGEVTVWEARTGRLARILLERGGGPSSFSPDGRWLAVSGANGGLFATGSWEQKRKLAGPAQFAPDSQMMVVTSGTHVLRLEVTLTGQELARLEDPNLDVAQNLVFTPDGTRLVVLTAGREVLHLWDLRLLREQLALRGLDWEAPRYPDVLSSANPLEVQLDRGDFDQLRLRQMRNNYDRAVQTAPHIAGRWYSRGIFHREEGRSELAIADLNEALKRLEKSENTRLKARCANDLARLYATAPERLRKTEDAVALAERAVRLQGGRWDYHNTLGIAYYRTGRLKEAIASLEKSLTGGAGQADAFDLYFLALCHHRLGDPAKSKAAFEKARVWQEQKSKELSKEQAEELNSFRAEASDVLNKS
jgi:serine/threonine protein kinase/WD40 repeat protein